MTASRQDVEAKLDAAVAEFKLTTSSGAKMVSLYGSDPSKWPAGHWRNGATILAAARAEVGQLLDPAPDPTPTPAPSPVDDVPQPEPPPFTPTRTLPAATTWSEFQTALAALQPGDRLPCRGVVMPGEAVIAKTLSAPAEIVFDSACKANGGAGLQFPAIWLKNIPYLRLISQGMVVSNPQDGSGVLVGGGSHFVLDGFDVRNCAGAAMEMLPTVASISDYYVRATVRDWSLVPSLDNHVEKGTGMHGCIMESTNTAYGIGPGQVVMTTPGSKMGGSLLEIGSGNSGNVVKGVRAWVHAENMLQDAQTQTAANALNLYGYLDDVEALWIYAAGLHGHAVSSDPYSSGFTNVRVAAGKAVNCCLNPRYAGQNPWTQAPGLAYPNPAAVTPKP